MLRSVVLLKAESPEDGWRALEEALEPFVRRRVAASDVDDLVQEILVAFAGASRSDRSPALLFTIARRRLASHHRARAREHARLARLAGEPDDPGGEPLSKAEADVAGALALFLEGLPEAHREAVRAVDVEGRAQADLARELGVPLSTIRSRVQRGRAELRAMLDRCCRIAVDARGNVVECEPKKGGCASDCTPTPRTSAPVSRAVS